ncbi:MAG: diguanylate cyclase domain-containing protein [Clostridia bacterium]|jgi:diguanylate cyclase (GGDEF) domain|nr:diguanylate cyclase [Oscillospiraceae bacterium]
MEYYTVIIFMAIFGLIIMDVVIYSSSFIRKDVKRRFIIIYTLAIFDAFAEWLGVMLNSSAPELRPLHLAVKCFELCTASLIPLLCSTALKTKRRTKGMYVLYALYGVHILLEIISMKTGFIFYVDANNVYHHGSMYFLYYAAFIPGIVLMMMESFRITKSCQGQDSHIMILSVIFLLGGLTVQSIDSSLKTDWLSSAIFGFLFFIYYSDLMQKIDNTTTLLNRRCYDSFTSKLRRKAVIVLIDVDKFKFVNDNYGHLYGDHALNVVGENLKGVFSKYGYCFRIGGDEMCAILLRKPKDMNKVCAKLNGQLDKLRADDEHIPTVSVGYTEYEPSESFTDAFARADEMMYNVKRKAAAAI